MIESNPTRGFRAVALLLVAAALCVACGNDAAVGRVETPPSSQAAQAAAAATSLGRRLKQRLVETLQAEGPVAAIEVCAVDAPGIAAELSEASGLSVGRTSLRVRNPANKPDIRERLVLERWAAAVDAGTPVSALGVHVEEGETFLWMKPIAVEGPCLTCHGKAIPDPVARAIADRYPDDAATGYDAGDLRGAFVVRAIYTRQ